MPPEENRRSDPLGLPGRTTIVRKKPTSSFRFTREDESLISVVGARLAANGYALERSGGPVDYYRITDPGSGEPRWILARHLDGVYRLYSGSLAALRTGTDLREVLLPDWLAPSGAA